MNNLLYCSQIELTVIRFASPLIAIFYIFYFFYIILNARKSPKISERFHVHC